MKNYWWASQNKTYKEEVPGGFLWSPKTRIDGGKNQSYVNMTLVKQGDIVFSFYKSKIQAIGYVVQPAQASIKPDFKSKENNWGNDGWLVGVEFYQLKKSISPKDYMDIIGLSLPKKHSPIQANGNGNQNSYLAEVSEPLADSIITIIGDEYNHAINSLIENSYISHNSDDGVEQEINEDANISATVKEQLIKARLGQGLFKVRVRQIEKCCLITGVSNINHLIASHIKPWRDCTNEERLDANNGLLLSPHIDHLFDRGFISFSNSGKILQSKYLDKKIPLEWNIDFTRNVGAFSPEQQDFLSYHRDKIFKGF